MSLQSRQNNIPHLAGSLLLPCIDACIDWLLCRNAYFDIHPQLSNWRLVVNQMEAAPGIEPGIKALQASALPLGYAASATFDISTACRTKVNYTGSESTVNFYTCSIFSEWSQARNCSSILPLLYLLKRLRVFPLTLISYETIP